MDIQVVNRIPFISFKEKNGSGGINYFILQKDHPHYLGIVSSNPTQNLPYAPMSGYRLWVVLSGTLQGRMVPSHPTLKQEIADTLRNMADWYLKEMINYPGVFDKFKEKMFHVEQK